MQSLDMWQMVIGAVLNYRLVFLIFSRREKYLKFSWSSLTRLDWPPPAFHIVQPCFNHISTGQHFRIHSLSIKSFADIWPRLVEDDVKIDSSSRLISLTSIFAPLRFSFDVAFFTNEQGSRKAFIAVLNPSNNLYDFEIRPKKI